MHTNGDMIYVYVPNVLSIRMRKRAKTWRDVLYACLVPVEPHAGRSASSCRRKSSARKMCVGTLDQAEEPVVLLLEWVERCRWLCVKLVAWSLPPNAAASCILRY